MKAAATRDSSQTTLKTAIPAEDEALKRNTDCVYFLASPLTCKKGIECEYRHSEEARMNPRDCWYWMNGNCLNAKCAFRHPPLDGLLGTATTPSTRLSLPPQTVASAQVPPALAPAHNSSKQGTPCFYHQKGMCLKGDRCPFMHVSPSVENLTAQPPVPKVTALTTEPQTLKMTFGILQKCAQQSKIPQANNIKPVEVLPPAKPPTKTGSTDNGIRIERSLPPTISFNNDLPRYKPTQVPPVISVNSVSRSHRGRQAQALDDLHFRNGKEPDEFFGESSPGFDVLVDDELRESEYYQNDEEFGRVGGHGGKHLNTVKDFDYGRSADYNSVAKYDREAYTEPRGYERYERVEAQYAREPRRVSTERITERSVVPERRGYPRAESPDQIDESDLRYRLSKQRKVNGSRSAVSPSRRSDFYRRDDRGRHAEDQRYRGQSRRDSRHLPPSESSMSNRLQGRISTLGKSSPDSNQHDSYREREMDRVRNWARLSPSRPPASSFRGTSQDRMKRRVHEDFSTEGRNLRGPLIRRDDSDNETSDFAAPKRLAELKGTKICEDTEEQQGKRRQLPPYVEGKNMKTGKHVGHLDLEDCSFEGPKPLSEILKRKRAEKEVGEGMVSGNKEESNKTVKGENQVSEEVSGMPYECKVQDNNQAPSNKEHCRSNMESTFGVADQEEEEEGLISEENVELANEGQPSEQKGSVLETDDIVMDKMEDQDLEHFDQRDEEYDYEQVDDGGDFKGEEDENADPEDEYFEDEEDDFAKKIGVLFS